MKKETKITGSKSGEMMVGDKHFPSKTLRILFVAAAICGRIWSEEGQYLRGIFFVACSEIKESNYSTHSTFAGRPYCFRYFTGSLRAQNYKCYVSRSTGILETLLNISAQSFI